MLFEVRADQRPRRGQVHRPVERHAPTGPARTSPRRIDDFKKLLTYTNNDRDTFDWTDAEKLVMDGKAGYQLMGDWEAADLDAKGFKDYGYAAFPGNGSDVPVAGRLVRAAQGRQERRRHEVLAEDGRQRRGPEGLQHQEGLHPGPYRRHRRPTTRRTSRPPWPTGRAATQVPSCAHGSACSQGWQGAVDSAMGKFSSDSDAAALQTALAAAAGAVRQEVSTPSTPSRRGDPRMPARPARSRSEEETRCATGSGTGARACCCSRRR